jgi:hypothetical protein
VTWLVGLAIAIALYLIIGIGFCIASNDYASEFGRPKRVIFLLVLLLWPLLVLYWLASGRLK